ncbi:mitochondrial carrier [Imleria badia]|nr:mitochondrial carrier [Imleria badia]
MVIRFASFETYKGWLANKATGKMSIGNISIAQGLITVMRLQAQQHSLVDPLETPRYRNAAHAAYTIVREEGLSTLYRGVSLTALRQATNQGANFTAYQELKKLAHRYQPDLVELPSYQHMIIELYLGPWGSFYKGITPRVLRVAPGQAIVFAVYERARTIIEKISVSPSGDHYTE